MDINGTLSSDQIGALSTVYLVSLSPSLIGSSSVLVVSIARWRHLQQQVLPLVQLALADLLAGLILMFTSAMNITADQSWLSINSKGICQHALPLSLTFYFVSFLLVVVYAWKSMGPMGGWRTQGENVRDEAQCRMRRLAVPVYAFVWLIPITLYIAYVFTNAVHAVQLVPPLQIVAENRTDEISEYCSNRCILFLHSWHHLDTCQLKETWHDIFVNIFLFLAVIPVLMYCSVIYYKVSSWYHRYTHEQEGYFPVEGDGRSRRRLRSLFSTTRKMVAVIIICWAPVLVLIVMSNITAWVKVQQWILFVFYVIQAAFMSLHGFLNSIVYAWSRDNFTEAVLGESTPLVHDRQPFYEESLRLTTS